MYLCTCVLLVSSSKGVGVGNSRVGITKKALFLSLIVILRLCPEYREWHLRLAQDQDRSLILEIHTRSAGRPGGQRHRSERLCSDLGSNIDRDNDLTGTSLRSPDIEGVVSADRWGQMIAPTELDERSSLAIIGGKDA